MNHTLIAAVLAALVLAACGEGASGPVATPADAEHGHDHGAGGEKVTHFTDRTELFVEFPALVAGEPSAFAAHLTTLADFRALAAGKVTVRLYGGGHPDEVFAVDGPSVPGIFRPEVTPRHAGERDVAIEVATPAFTVTHALGPFTVHRDRRAADAEPAPEEDEGIGFTKEQQWKVDFATAEVVSRPIRTAVPATGVLRARSGSEALVAAVAAGQVQPAGAFPRLGETVRKGELIAWLVPRLGGETDLASLRAAAEKARVEHELARQELARMEALYRDEAVPEKRVLAARAAAETSAAELAATRERVAQYGGASGGIPLRAQVSGSLAAVHVAAGAYVEAGAPLFHIADRARLWLDLRVAEFDAPRLGTPTGATFRVPGSETSVDVTPKNGKLVAVGGVVDPATRTVPVVFEFSPEGLNLPIGMAVQAQVYTAAARDAVAIPASAVLDEAGTSVVFVQTGGESFERRQVRLGSRDGDWVEVIDGLTPGSRVVSRGAYLVKLASTGTAQIGHGHAH